MDGIIAPIGVHVPVGGRAPVGALAQAGDRVRIVRVQTGADQTSGDHRVHTGATILAGATIPVIILIFMVPVIAGAHAGHGDCHLLTA